MFTPRSNHHRPPKEDLRYDKWRFLPSSVTAIPSSPRHRTPLLDSANRTEEGSLAASIDGQGSVLLIAESKDDSQASSRPQSRAAPTPPSTARVFRPTPPSILPMPPPTALRGPPKSLFHKSPFRRPPPPKPAPPPDEHHPLMSLLTPEEQCVPPPSPGLGSSRRRSSGGDLSHVATPNAGRSLEATISPNRRNGRVVFSEGMVSYILDSTSKAIVVCRRAFLPAMTSATTSLPSSARSNVVSPISHKMKGIGHRVGNMVSYQHQYNGDRTLEAVNIGPPVRDASTHRRQSDSSSGSRESPPLHLSRSASMASMSMEFRSSRTTSQQLATFDADAGLGRSDYASHSDTPQMPTEGWELFVQLERVRGNRTLLDAPPDALVRLVDAACSPKPGKSTDLGGATTGEGTNSVDECVPKDGPLLRVKAQEWASKHSVTDVLKLGAATLQQINRAEDKLQLLGLRSVFEEPPLRFKPHDIDAFVAPPPAVLDGRRVTTAGLAASAYGSWYIKPERRKTVFDEGQNEVKQRQEASAAAAREAKRSSRGLATTAYGSFRASNIAALSSRIERVQARDNAAITALLMEAAAQQQANNKLSASPSSAFGAHPSDSPQQSPFGTPSKTASPANDSLVPNSPLLPKSIATKKQAEKILSGPIRVAPPEPTNISRRHRLERGVYLGKNWALSQGEILTNRNVPQDLNMEEENKAFVMQFAMRNKPKIAVNYNTVSAAAYSPSSPTRPAAATASFDAWSSREPSPTPALPE